MKNIKSILFLLLLCSGAVFAQQNAMYTQYMFNGLILNPAYAGSREVINLTALQRYQWYNIEGAPVTTTFSADAPVAHDKVGLGLSVLNDKIGVSNNLDITGYFSYRIKFDKGRTFAMGMSATFTQYSTDFSSLGLNTDRSFQQNVNAKLPNFGVGFYYTTPRYYLGLSMPTLLSNRIDNGISVANNAYARQFQHFFFTAGYLFDITSDIKLKPSILWKVVSGAPMSLDLNTNVWFFDLVMFGVSWRSFDSIDFLFTLQATKQLQIGYAYDRSFTYAYNRTGSHEIMLNYKLNYGKGKTLSPRYF